MIAALYVLRDGPYFNLPDVDPWDEERDARTYPGPWPVVAHPPCKRWGRYWSGGPNAAGKFKKGADGGCFEAALAAVRKWGGVIEHPEASHAWNWFGLSKPPKSGGWIRAGLTDPGWTCCVEQGHYGHLARKATWLYAVGIDPKDWPLRWGKSEAKVRLDDGFASAKARKEAKARGHTQARVYGYRAIASTPVPFRDLLLSMARSSA